MNDSAAGRVEVIGGCTLILGNCLDVLPTLGKVDAVVTDPPYGVNLGEYTGTSRYKNKPYASFDDTPEYIKTVCVPAIVKCLEISKRLSMTPGNRCMFMYPQPADIGIWYNPASTNRGRWGFSYANAFIYYYGADPHNSGNGMIPNSLSGACDSIAGIDHPCPKPLNFMKWLVRRTSLDGETVLDPFMGSGTTLVACAKMGRKGIGIELDEKYFDIACKRVEQAYKQGDFFLDRPKPPTQEVMEI